MEAAQASAGERDGLAPPRRYYAAAGVIAGIVMAVLDGAIVNIALPTIAQAYAVSAAESVWVLNAYQLALASAVLPAATLGEMLGPKRFYVMGLLVFACGALAAALSASFDMLVAARALQGLGAACVLGLNGALLRHTYPNRLLGRGVGLNSTCIAMAATVGPSVGAAIMAAGSLPWVFAVSIPFATIALALAPTLPPLPAARRGEGKFDAISAALNAATFGLLIYAVAGVGHGQALGVTLLAGALSACACVLLVRRSARQASPLLPLDLFRNRLFALSSVTSLATFSAQALALVTLPFLLHNKLHFTVAQAGLVIMFWPLALAVAAPLAGRLADRHQPGTLGAVGLALLSVGMLGLALASEGDPVWTIALRMALCGFGFGLFHAPNARAMLLASPKSRSAQAGSVVTTSRLLGQGVGTALVAMVFALSGDASATPLLLGAALAALSAVLSSARNRL
jgi:DHA2 family multidrug resistance protein-like MFS transporter